MTKCKELPLDDIVTMIDYRGKTPKKSTSGIPLITAKIIKNGRIYTPTEFISEDEYVERMTRGFPQIGDILITTEAPLGEVAELRDAHVAMGQRIITMHANKNLICGKYLKYYLLSHEGQSKLRQRESGTTVTGIKQAELRKVLIPLPPLYVQQRISRILDTLDDKIELNEKINQNLEAQAQAIFKSWFIDFEPFKNGKFIDSELGKIPEGWKVGKLSDIANITMGQSPNGNSYNEKKIGMIFFQGRAEFGWRFPRNRLYTTAPKRIAERDSVLLSIRAPVGDINKALERCCIGRGLASLTSNHKTFLYYKMQSIRHLLDVYNGEGTVFGSINKNTLQEIRTIIPIDSEIIRFELKLKVVDELIRNNYIENLRLIKLRDTLLPELMSGKIDILRFSNR